MHADQVRLRNQNSIVYYYSCHGTDENKLYLK